MFAAVAATAWVAIVATRKKFTRPVQNAISRHPATVAADLLVVVVLLLLATVMSTMAVLTFSDMGWVEVLNSRSTVATTTDPATVSELHESAFWHMADAVPVLDMPAAWGWDNPVRITGRLTWLAGLPFLFTRALVALGIVGLLIDGWRAYSPKSPLADTS